MNINSKLKNSINGYFFLICSLMSTITFAESKQDSLLLIYKNGTEKQKLEVVQQIGYNYRNTSKFDSSLFYLKDALSISEQLNINQYSAKFLNDIGVVYYYLYESQQALKNFKESLKIAQQLKDQKLMALNHAHIAMIMNLEGKFDQAINYYIKAIEVYDQLNDTLLLGSSYNNIGLVYSDMGDTKNAIKYYKKSIYFKSFDKNQMSLSRSYVNIGIAFDIMAESLEPTQQKIVLDSALYFTHKALKIRQKSENWFEISNAYNNLAILHFHKKNVDSAEYYYRKAFEIDDSIGADGQKIYSLLGLGEVMIEKENFNAAIQYIEQAVLIAKKLEYSIELKDSYQLLSDIAFRTNNFKDALKFEKLKSEINDSLFNESKSKEIGKLEATYEMEKKQAEEERLKQEQEKREHEEKKRRDNIQYSLIFLGILLVFGSVLGLGFVKVSPKFAEGLIFFAFLIFFEFCLVLLDPIIDDWSSGEPIYKLLFNAVLAGAIFPLHAFFEKILKNRILKS
jgi:tetratricopeptide (TPR) repeat protein